MNTNRIRKSIWARTLTAVIALNMILGNFSVAFAGVTTRVPNGAGWVVGSGNPITAGDTTITQNTLLGVINWDSFGIAGGEIVNFNQPNANALTVNRVTGTYGTDLLGTLNADGAVWILNPNGILIGDGASVNASSFAAVAGDFAPGFMDDLEAADPLGTDPSFVYGAPIILGGGTGDGSGTITVDGNIITPLGTTLALAGEQIALPSVFTTASSLVMGVGDVVYLGNAAGGAITLSFDNTYNMDLTGTRISAGGDLTLHANTLTVGDILATGNDMTLHANNVDNTGGGYIIAENGLTLDVANNADLGNTYIRNLDGEVGNDLTLNNRSILFFDGNLALGDLIVGGTFDVTAGGSLTQASGTAIDIDTLVLDVGTFATLYNDGNAISRVEGSTVGNLDLKTDSALTIAPGGLTVGAGGTGDFLVTTGGDLEQIGVVNAGALRLNVGGSVTLENDANSFTSVAGIVGWGTLGGSLSLHNAGSLILGDSSGNLTVGFGAPGGLNVVVNTGTLTQEAGRNVIVNGGASASATLTTLDGDMTLGNVFVGNGLGTLGLNVAGGDLVQDLGTFINVGALTLDVTGDAILDRNNNIASVGGTVSDRLRLYTQGDLDVYTLTANALTLVAQNNLTEVVGATITAGDRATLLAGDTLALGAVTVNGTGDLTLNAGTLVQRTVGSPAITAGALTLGVTGSASLDSANNNFASVGGTAGSLSIRDRNALDLRGLTVGGGNGALNIRTGGALTQSGAVNAGATTLNVTGNATLNNAGNDFNSVAGTVTGFLNVSDQNALVLGTLTVGGGNGALTVTTGGALTQTGTGINAGLTTLTVTGNATLNNANNSFNSLGGTVTGALNVRDRGALLLRGLTVGSGGNGALTIRTGGNLTQTAGTAVNAGATTLNVTGNATLANANNDFNSMAGTVTGALNVRDRNALVLGTLTVGGGNGALTVTTGGNLTQTAGSAVNAGATTLNVTGNATLANANNDFNSLAGTVTGALNVRDRNALVLGTLTVGGGNGALTVTTGGALTQTGTGINAGLTTLNVTGNATLNNANNSFNSLGGTVTGALNVRDRGALLLRDLTVGGGNGALTIRTGGNLTQTAGSAVNAGTTTLNVTGNATLANANNDFNSMAGTVTGALNVRDRNALALGNLTVGGGNGNLTLTTGGNLTQLFGTSVNAGAALLDVTGNATLANANNDFTSIRGTVTGNMSVRDRNELVLGSLTVGGGNGDLTVRTGGDLTQFGFSSGVNAGALTLDVTGNATLLNAGNNFNSVGTPTGRSVTGDLNLYSTGDLAMRTLRVGNNLNITAAGSLTENVGATIVVGNAATLTANDYMELGYLTVNGSGALNLNVDNGNLFQRANTEIVAGNTILAVDGYATLNSALNDFGSIGGVVGDYLTVRDRNALVLGELIVGGGNGALTIRTGGNLTQRGETKVEAGALTLNVAGNATLLNEDNDFNSVGTAMGGSVTGDLNLYSKGDLRMRTLRVGNNMGIEAEGSLIENVGATIVVGNAATLTANDYMELGYLTVNGDGDLNLNVWNGDLFQRNNTVMAAGAVVLDVDGNASLNSPFNDFYSVEGTAANLTIRDRNDLILNGVNIGNGAGTLTVTTGGGLTDTAANFAGALVLNVAGDAVLDNRNDFYSVEGTAANLTLRDRNNLILNGVNIGGGLGNLNLLVRGNLDDTAPNFAGAVTLNVGGNAVLDEDNDFISVAGIVGGRPGGGYLTINDINDLDLAGVNVGHGNGTLTVTTGGGLTDSAPNQAGRLVLGVTGNAVLDDANDFYSVEGTAQNLTINDINNLVLAGVNIGGGAGVLDVTTGGGLTDSAANFAGRLILDVTEDAVLDNRNDFYSVEGTAANLTLRDRNDLVLAGVNIGNGLGNLNLIIGGNLTDSAANQAGAVNLRVRGDAVLDDDNDFISIAGTAANLTVNDINDLDLAGVNIGNGSGTLIVTTGRHLTDSAPNTAGRLILGVGGNGVLDDENDFTTVEGTAGTLHINDINDLDLAGLNIGNGSGRLIVTVGDNLTDSAPTFAGTTTLRAARGNIILDHPLNNYSGPVDAEAAGNVHIINAERLNLARVQSGGGVWGQALNGDLLLGNVNAVNDVWFGSDAGNITVGSVMTRGSAWLQAAKSITAGGNATKVTVDRWGRAKVSAGAPNITARTVGLKAGGSVGQDSNSPLGARSSTPLYVHSDSIAVRAGKDVALYNSPSLHFGNASVTRLDGQVFSMSNLDAKGAVNLTTPGRVTGDLTVGSLVLSVGDYAYDRLRVNGQNGKPVDLWMNNVVGGGNETILGIFNTNGGKPGSKIRTGALWKSGAMIFINGMYAGGDPRYLARIAAAEAFPAETPELKSKQGVFGGPVFVHDQMDINEPVALGLIELFITQKYSIAGDPAFSVDVLEDIPATGLTPRNTYWFK